MKKYIKKTNGYFEIGPQINPFYCKGGIGMNPSSNNLKPIVCSNQLKEVMWYYKF